MTTSDGKIFHSEEEMRESDKTATLEVARQNGFDVVVAEPDGTVCGKPGESELIVVKDDGSWTYMDTTAENKAAHVTATGTRAQFLRMYFFNPAQYMEETNGDN